MLEFCSGLIECVSDHDTLVSNGATREDSGRGRLLAYTETWWK